MFKYEQFYGIYKMNKKGFPLTIIHFFFYLYEYSLFSKKKIECLKFSLGLRVEKDSWKPFSRIHMWAFIWKSLMFLFLTFFWVLDLLWRDCLGSKDARHLNRCKTNEICYTKFEITILNFIHYPPDSSSARLQRDREEKWWMCRLTTIMLSGLRIDTGDQRPPC